MVTPSYDVKNNDVIINQENFLNYAEERGFGDLHIKVDAATGLHAIVAIHSTKLGPSLGGCRFIEYKDPFAALYDAMRLARAMSYKAALVNLPLGGGKSVLIKPQGNINRRAYFSEFGRFVNDLGGRYITAIDSGTTMDDMDVIGEQTPYVASLSKFNGEPSPCTARGIFRGIEAAVYFKLGKPDVKGLHIAIQGAGKVGYHLAEFLHHAGAKISIADINSKAVDAVVNAFGATAVPITEIHRLECDVFSPCALGAIINDITIPQLRTSIIAGAANNQLARAFHGDILHEKGILYATDYVINAGGLIYASSLYNNTSQSDADAQVDNIYQSLMTIFERSSKENIACSLIADTIAQEKLS